MKRVVILSDTHGLLRNEVKEELKEIQPDGDKIKEKETSWLKKAESLFIPPVMLESTRISSIRIEYGRNSDKLPGKAGEIVESLSEEQLIALAAGDPGKGQGSALGSAGFTVPGAAAETSSVAVGDPWNVASMVLADGPAGLRLNQRYQVVDGSIQPQEFLNSIEGGFFPRICQTPGCNPSP